MIQLRTYQQDAKNNIYNLWNSGSRNNLLILPTGAGKTVIFSEILREHQGAACAIAHRQELVEQISLALANVGIRHRIIAPNNVVRSCVQQHQEKLKQSFYDSSALVGVAGIDTLVRRGDQYKQWLSQVTLWVQDEAHHILQDNKWGKGLAFFPNARGLGVTACSIRLDKKGLGAHKAGVFDEIYVGPSRRELINRGFLTDYRIFAPPSDLNLENVKITKSGEYSDKQLTQAVKQSTIVGDIVQHYLKYAAGKLGITFVESVETASTVASAFRVAGVTAEVVSAKTAAKIRTKILKDFKEKKILQLINVDLFGEGFDLPAIEVVSMARPTQSLNVYMQQFGRVLRPILSAELMQQWDDFTDEQRLYSIASSEKPRGVIIDHVGNTIRMVEKYGNPDTYNRWSLDGSKKTEEKDPDDIPQRACYKCTGLYERYLLKCPYCGYVEVPTERNSPDFVDGDLVELDPLTLEELTKQISRISGAPRIPQGVHNGVKLSIRKNHIERQEAQDFLKNAITWWAGVKKKLNYSQREAYKLFYFRFGIDVLTAQTLGRPDAEKLTAEIWYDIQRLINKHDLKGVQFNA